jgi:hypothetical protein
MSNVILVKKSDFRHIKRDRKGAVIRINSQAADVLEGLLDQAGGRISIMELASSLIEYAAKDTIIKWEDEESE